MVVLLYFYILIVVRVKYLGEDVKNYMNNGLFCLKIWKINIKIGILCEYGEIYWYNYIFYVKDRYFYNIWLNDDVVLIDDIIS